MSALALTLLAATVATPAAHARGGSRADLHPTLVAPANLAVDAEGRFEVVVDNLERRRADDVVLHIYLPRTSTSPQVHVLGDVGAMAPGCALSNTTVICDLGSIAGNGQGSAWVDLALPWSSEDIVVATAVATSTRETDARNNEDEAVVPLVYDQVAVAAPEDADVRFCAGSDLTSFYECELYPSSIRGHSLVMEAGGTISFPGAGAAYGGTWSQPSPDALEMTYTRYGRVVVEFSGNGVSADCFEGLTTFPGSTSVAPYEVCLR